jgi:type IV pilus assembly protein PilN
VVFGAGLYLRHSQAAAVRDRERTLDSSITSVRHEKQTYDTMVRQPDNAQVLDHAATLNRLFDEKAFSWTLAMEDLETVLPGGVQVATLEPIRNNKNGKITVHMRVVGPRDKAVELVQNLERSRRFLAPRITGEMSEAAGNGGNQVLEPVSPTNRVNFDLMADYNAAAPSERHGVTKEANLEEVSATRHTSRPIRTAPGSAIPASPSRKTVPPHPGGAE